MPRLGNTWQHQQDTYVNQFGDEAGKLRILDSCWEIAVWWMLALAAMQTVRMGGSRMTLLSPTLAGKADNS